MNKLERLAMQQALPTSEARELIKSLDGEFYFATPHRQDNCEHCGADYPNHYAGCSVIADTYGKDKP